MSCLVPFLEHSLIDSLPYLVASSLATFPVSLHRDIVNTLCHYLLPFTLSKADTLPLPAAVHSQ